jgi:hypothetical protein
MQPGWNVCALLVNVVEFHVVDVGGHLELGRAPDVLAEGEHLPAPDPELAELRVLGEAFLIHRMGIAELFEHILDDLACEAIAVVLDADPIRTDGHDDVGRFLVDGVHDALQDGFGQGARL